jgi:tetratricopeptide (TPR) repeat protein
MVQWLEAQTLHPEELYPFIQLKNGNYQEVIDYYIHHPENPPKVFDYLARAEAAWQLGLYDKALDLCQEIEKMKKNASTPLQIKIYLHHNDYSKAQKSFLKNVESFEKISLFTLFNDPCYQKLIHTDFLDSILKADLYSDEEKQIFKVEQLIHHEKLTEALFLVQEVISRNNHLHRAYYLHSVISATLNDNRKALAMINEALALTKVPADYFLQRASLLVEDNHFEEALTDIEKVIRKEPYEVNHYLYKAEILHDLGRYDEALSLATDLLTLMPQNSNLLILKARSLYQSHQMLEALKTVNVSFEYRQSLEQFVLRGDIYSATGTWEYALSDYSMGVDIDPFNGDLYAKKGYARLKTGDLQGACYDWKKGKRYGSHKAVRYWDTYCR